MTANPFDPVKALRHAVAAPLRSALRRAQLGAAAGLTGLVGAGFLLGAAYGGLSHLVGREVAALLIGSALLALAGLALLALGRQNRPRDPAPTDRPHSRPGEAATLTLFTAAYVVGRRLSARRRP